MPRDSSLRTRPRVWIGSRPRCWRRPWCCCWRRRRLRAVSSAGVKNNTNITSTPDDHFAASPDFGVTVSSRGRVGNACSCPAIHGRVVSAASVFVSPPDTDPSQTMISVPVQTALLSSSRAEAALVVPVGVQVSVSGVYVPPDLDC